MSHGYTDASVVANGLTLDYSTPTLSDEDVNALGNDGMNIVVEVDATALNISEDAGVTNAYLAALAVKENYTLKPSADVTIPAADTVKVDSVNKFTVTFTPDTDQKAMLKADTIYAMTIAAASGVPAIGLSVHCAPNLIPRFTPHRKS